MDDSGSDGFGQDPSVDEEISIERPNNTGPSPPFHTIITGLINPLLKASNRKTGFHGGITTNLRVTRFKILSNYIQKWKKDVGNDIYPCFRLVLPYKDKERQMYGLKEKAIARLLIKILGISPDSEDATSLINYKLPGQYKGAGDFAERCFEVMRQREIRSEYGSMTIDEVNELLDDLSKHSKSDDQLPILSKFYQSLNADEMKWLIRVILRQMHIGVSERTLFSAWHPNANELFNISSSLKRVCWELFDSNYRLSEDAKDVNLMSCFQPQLAAFPKASYEQVVKSMNNEAFFIEEKLDGERIQLHMAEYGKSFKFYSRRAKDYTYLYGSSLDDKNGALTKYLRGAFEENVENCILDGEMVSWDPVDEKIEPFGYLKTAANAEKEDAGESYPLYRVFDILYANNKSVVNYSLVQRQLLLHRVMNPVPTRFEIHPHQEGSTKEDIERRLRQVIAESSEGLVIKLPTAPYVVNGREDSWIKVKPEYMLEFGENLDCLVIGGYYGQGKRGQNLASFLCGLRVDNEQDPDAQPKFWSFCRVGGGFTAAEYATIRHLTDGLWQKWDPRRPPLQYMELAGEKNDKEMPDVWILPEKSLVLEIKAASVVPESEQYRTNTTLRFPRFRRIRQDKNYLTALSVKEFMTLKEQAETESQERQLELEEHRRAAKRPKKELRILGGHETVALEGAPTSQMFTGHIFCILVDSKRKSQLQKIIISHGGTVVQDVPSRPQKMTHIIADKDLVKIASLKRQGKWTIIRPTWIHDSVFNQRMVPYEPRHVYFAADDVLEAVRRHVDQYGDSYTRSIEDPKELRDIFNHMPDPNIDGKRVTYDILLGQSDDPSLFNIPSLIFYDTVIYLDEPDLASNEALPPHGDPLSAKFRLEIAANYATFGGARISSDISDREITHIATLPEAPKNRVSAIRSLVSFRLRVPRVVSVEWLEQSWKESTRLSEEDFAV
ncbi:ATP dependent DNA ligase domain-containing protein [Lipomyces tetrasporus]|uniref:DNA ligase n=1 Tax=Lipomyces tetrasporus TaxID=54092 RepID=A0AAD7QW76_9ASCO|nr:ATP dependent DNA ligase domain-containing protein [Lipomyces tetrasporus]KAJ8102650.1 ATP dependent DNA ligase domain-containing protein [Lipomyces tetrasporus]